MRNELALASSTPVCHRRFWWAFHPPPCGRSIIVPAHEGTASARPRTGAASKQQPPQKPDRALNHLHRGAMGARGGSRAASSLCVAPTASIPWRARYHRRRSMAIGLRPRITVPTCRDRRTSQKCVPQMCSRYCGPVWGACKQVDIPDGIRANLRASSLIDCVKCLDGWFPPYGLPTAQYSCSTSGRSCAIGRWDLHYLTVVLIECRAASCSAARRPQPRSQLQGQVASVYPVPCGWHPGSVPRHPDPYDYRLPVWTDLRASCSRRITGSFAMVSERSLVRSPTSRSLGRHLTVGRRSIESGICSLTCSFSTCRCRGWMA